MFRKIDGLIFEQMIGATHLSCRAPIGCNNLRLKGDRSPLPQPHKRKLRMSSIQIYAVVTPATLGVTFKYASYCSILSMYIHALHSFINHFHFLLLT